VVDFLLVLIEILIDIPFGLLSGVPDVITHAKFCVNRLGGFSAAAPRKVPFPILFRTTLTTVLHYGPDCDKRHFCNYVRRSSAVPQFCSPGTLAATSIHGHNVRNYKHWRECRRAAAIAKTKRVSGCFYDVYASDHNNER